MACGGSGGAADGDGSGDDSTGIVTLTSADGSGTEGETDSEGRTGSADGTGTNDESAEGSQGSQSGSAGPDLPVFDVGSWDPIDDCSLLQDGDGGTSFSIIWIANSPEGTVSKIDTKTATELARYRTGPGSPDPSRTAVNLDGDVAVSNRRGSVTKIAANEEDCIDQNGDGEITTSTGPDDILDWGADECILWHYETAFDESVSGSNGGPRATAWTGGRFDEDTCQTVDIDLFVGWRNQPATSVTIEKIDGDDGTQIGEVVVDEWPMNWGHGAYGGAADANGDLWGLGTAGSILRIDGEDFTVDRWDNPETHIMYGIALDANGDPWIAGYSGNLWHFDRSTETWVDKGPADGGPTRMRGLAIDQDGFAWIAGNSPCGLIQYDTAAGTYTNTNIALPGCSQPVGVSIDVDGMVWVVDRGANQAYKVDPSDYSSDVVTGLVSPYTYSDMTGAGLGLVINPPG